jgi:hypothetical protein
MFTSDILFTTPFIIHVDEANKEATVRFLILGFQLYQPLLEHTEGKHYCVEGEPDLQDKLQKHSVTSSDRSKCPGEFNVPLRER